jgi:hypothetical protein
VEAFLNSGADFVTAIDRVNEAIDGTPAPVYDAPDAPTEHVPTPAENERALVELKSMMGGL